MAEGVEQTPDARIGGGGDRGGAIAGDQPPSVEHADAIGERERFAHVVRDDDHGLAQARLDAAELGVQLGAGQRIERAERLVHQQHRRIDRQRARHADALALAARQLVGPAGRELCAGSPTSSSSSCTRADARRRPFLEARHHRHVVRDRHVRKEPDVLQHVADVPPQRDRFPLACVAPFHEDRALVGQQQPVDELQQRALAGAAAADQREHVAGVDAQAEIVEHARLPRSRERHAAKLNRRNGHRNCDGNTSEASHHARRQHRAARQPADCRRQQQSDDIKQKRRASNRADEEELREGRSKGSET